MSITSLLNFFAKCFNKWLIGFDFVPVISRSYIILTSIMNIGYVAPAICTHCITMIVVQKI